MNAPPDEQASGRAGGRPASSEGEEEVLLRAGRRAVQRAIDRLWETPVDELPPTFLPDADGAA